MEHDGKVCLIAARAKNYYIGRNGDLPWKLPLEYKYFLKNTQAGYLIFGRKTYEQLAVEESVHSKSHMEMLARSVVVTRQTDFKAPGTLGCAVSVKAGVDICREESKRCQLPADSPKSTIWICGGENVYREALSFGDYLFLTLVDLEVAGDAKFPQEYEAVFTQLVSSVPQQENGINYSFTVLRRSPV